MVDTVASTGPVSRPWNEAGERAETGRAARQVVNRSALATHEPPATRDPVDILVRQGEGRQADLLPIRYGRMATSPFAFLRGAAAVMAHDLGPSPVTGLTVQAIGDAHVSNFGVFASPERRLVFDVNDFDETLRAPWEWDVKRLAASAAVAVAENGAGKGEDAAAAQRTAAAYRRAMRGFAAESTLDVWYAHLDVEDIAETRSSKRRRRESARALAKIRRRTSEQVAGKLTERADGGGLRFRSIPPLVTPLRELIDPDDAERVREMVLRGFSGYRKSLTPDRRLLLDRYRLVDFARKVVGVGSVGTRCLIALLTGHGDDDVLVLQLKEAGPSVLEPYAGGSPSRHHGARVVNGQRVVQVASDVFLGWNTLAEGGHFYWRQLRDMKASAEIATLGAKELGRYLDACAWCLAHAHARSGDPIAMAAYLGSGDAFDRAMAAFAVAYAAQTRDDWSALKGAIADGRLAAQAGV
ncbi:MAG TPA: DUF2252 domain-containing protein [Thermoleophilia bacterium]|nr:DUF2252 domain-containing protein [Thermoleophilia bacterium]